MEDLTPDNAQSKIQGLMDSMAGDWKKEIGKEARFSTVQEAEAYYMSVLAPNNDDERGMLAWLEKQDIEETRNT